MSQLTFNTDEGRSTSNLISTSCSNLGTELTSLRNNINSLVGSAWIGQSATQFQGEFEQWANTLQNVINELETMKGRLEMEISQWEETASAFA